MILFENAVTFVGRSSPFLSLCHCFAIRGNNAAKEFVVEAFLPEHAGQPEPRPVRFAGVARHSWSGAFEQIHQANLLEAGATSFALIVPFLIGCH
jgi:hypothetical protein